MYVKCGNKNGLLWGRVRVSEQGPRGVEMKLNARFMRTSREGRLMDVSWLYYGKPT